MAENTIPEEIRASLICRACKTFLRPPIRMCRCGVNVCDLCKVARGSVCPACRGAIGDHTNVELEKLVWYFRVPMSCRYSSAGCPEALDLDDILAHEDNCRYRNLKCLVPDCKAEFALIGLEDHMSEKHKDMEGGMWVIGKIDTTPAEDMVAGVPVVRGRDWEDHHYKDIKPTTKGTMVRATPGYPGWVEVRWATGLGLNTNYNHRMGLDGKYEVQPASMRFFAIRSWRHSDVRFFATVFVCSDDFWHIMVTAAGYKEAAAKFRAEIRLASQYVPEYSNVYHRPVVNFETGIDLPTMEKYRSCLDVHKKVVLKLTGGKVAHLPRNPKDMPFTCQVYEKVFATFDKDDIDEK